MTTGRHLLRVPRQRTLHASSSRPAREHVKQLEQEYDSMAGEEHPPLPAGEIDSERLTVRRAPSTGPSGGAARSRARAG
jgi:hypothetical protein